MRRVIGGWILAVLGASGAWATVDVPVLKSIVPDGDGSKIAYGIYVKVGDGGEARLFQLDTGNGSFLAGYADNAPPQSQFWGSGVTMVNSGTFSESFGSGITMMYNKVSTQVTLSNASGADLVVIPTMVLGQVFSGTGDDIPSDTYWNQTLANGDPPLHQTYYGNFGAGLYRASAPSDPVDEQLFSALGQISGVVGFSLSLSGSSPKLTLVFDTPEDQDYIDSFTQAALMVSSGSGGPVFPVTGWATHTEFPALAAAYSVDGVSVSGTNGVFDTGGTTVGLTDEAWYAFDAADLTKEDGTVLAGETFLMGFTGAGEIDGTTFGDFSIGFTTGYEAGVNEVDTFNGSQEMNYGPAIYNFYDVYYDLEFGTVRFRAVPESSVSGLLALALAGFAGWRRFFRGTGRPQWEDSPS
ncbi:MAG TPA: hypothetical protein PLS03_03805 [Terrimicrobiaceae bacterium]|nr:hypothetical protein [Terrimicrobiaceae bacterium]